MRIGAAYIRVSTDDQLEFSPDSQLGKIKEYAKHNDIILSDDFIFMEDEGRSGRDAKRRPEFQRMIGTAKTKPKPFDVILVWKFSRFARNREDSIVYKSMLRKQCGIDVVSVSENIGDDKMSILIEAIIEAMDEWYSVNLAEEVVRGMTEKASRGGVVAAPPFGYLMGEHHYTPDPEKAPIVQLIFDKYVNGNLGCFEIAQLLNTMGVRSKRGNAMQNRTVEYILNNPAYIGKIRWSPDGKLDRKRSKPGMIVVDGAHQPIVDADVFQQAQNKLSETKARYAKHARIVSNPDFLLKGLIRCSNCGSTLVRSNAGLQCHSYSKGECQQSHYIALSRITPRVVDLIEDTLKHGAFEIAERNPAANVDNEICSAQIAKEKQKLQRIRAAYEDGIDTLEEYKANKTKILDTISALENERKRPPKRDVRKLFFERNKHLVSILRNPEIDEGEKNKALHGCVDQIVFDRAKNQLQLFFAI